MSDDPFFTSRNTDMPVCLPPALLRELVEAAEAVCEPGNAGSASKRQHLRAAAAAIRPYLTTGEQNGD